jgi:hypothetical protein
MTIKNEKKKVLTLESSNKQLVTVDLTGAFDVKIESGEENFNLTKPGEYEFRGVDVLAKEITTEPFTSNANIYRIGVDRVRVGIIRSFMEIPKEDLASILDLDVLIVPETAMDNLSKLANLFDPEKLIVFQTTSNFEQSFPIITKALTITEVIESGSIKFKEEEFTQSEDKKLQVFYLKA